MSTAVNAFLRVVANGVAPSQGRGSARLRATLIATPELLLDGADASQAIDLAQWPSQLAERIQRGVSPASGRFEVELHLQRIGAPGEPVLGREYRVKAAAVGHARVDPKDWAGATAAWREALTRELRDPWTALARDIAGSLEGRKHKAEPASRYDAPDTAPQQAFDADGAILTPEARASDTMVIKGIVPVRQGRFAIDEERIRAARVLAKTTRGPHVFQDEPLMEIGRTRKGEIADFDEARRTELYRQFREATVRTNGDRGETHTTFGAIHDIVTGAGEAAADAFGVRGDRALVPRAEDVRSGKGRVEERATHAYGTWLQRRPELTYKPRADKRGRPIDPSRSVEREAAEDRVRGLFYAFQGDPFLSRLFCLAIDLEFTLPDELQGVADPVYLRISAGPPGEASRRRTPRVATAAKLEAGGFWPASIFEAGVTSRGGVDTLIHEPALVEQSGGFWRLDHGYAPKSPAAHAPRYDLTSLDIRRAVDAKPDAVDRGERHLTGGFTILDNGRGEQVARDLALAASNATRIVGAAAAGERPLVVLYAEELTIGRRVDVASAAPGAAVETLDWRSLMYRFVRYVGLDRTPERLLSGLLGGREPDGRHLDEGSFQVAARLMPLVHAAGGGERQVEAVPEEAVFSWDGTPAGALTEAGAGAEGAGQEMPFRRRMEPPSMTGSGRALCPAPLRFGAPYLFRWRSFFLGGGSPPLRTAMTGESAGRAMLPPAIDGKAAPRRFLRHENIAPPVLLLPQHLATLDYGPMGFEQADQAIVRSAVAADPRARGSEPPSPGPAYMPLSQRTQPAETMRVFVVPEVAPEMVERHGRLDDASTAGAVRRGGLLDVTFDPADRSRTPERKATGFPTVLTRSAQGFGLDPVPYARVLHRGDGERIGIPVFEPGGRNATPAGGIGYLPDPAAEEYCVRLRVQRSGRYLAGGVTVQVYDAGAGIAYPHALPLVVTVRREERERPQPAVQIDEVIEGGVALHWMAPTGRISPSRPRNGTRVRHVVVKLCRGEDFALEVTCIPKPALLSGTFSLPETVAMQLAEARIDRDVRERLEALTGPLAERRFVGGEAGSGLTGLAGRPVPGGGAVGKAARDILDTIAKTSPVEELAAVTILRVCHAINAPPETAAHILSGLRARRPTIPKTDGWERTPELDDAPGAEGMLITGALRLDLERVDAFELVATSAAVGSRPLDDAARARSLAARRAGRWPKLTTVDGERRYVAPRFVVGFDVDEAGRVTFPTETVRLLRVDNLPARAEAGIGDGLFGGRAGRLTEVSLGRLYAAALAERPILLPVDGDPALPKEAGHEARSHIVKTAQDHRIADTRARKLLLTVTTLSRSAEAFETAPRYGGGDGVLHRRQPLRASDQARSSRAFELWVPSTERPPVCAVRRPEIAPVITREAVNGKDGIVQRVCRKVLTRLYLKRGWNASGEGERLGIVLWPPNYFEQTETDVDGNVVAFNGRRVNIAWLQDADLGPGGAFVTRWGGDPTRRDACPQEGVLIPPSAFEDATDGCASPHRPRIVPRARMPVRPSSQAGAEAAPNFMDVTLLTFEPCFDLDREEWYVDIDLKPNRATDPFVRFGLVRYQEHAISPDLSVSYPVVCHAQVMPRRDLALERRKGENGNGVLRITLTGHGATGIQPLDLDSILKGDPRLPDLRASFGTLARPEVRVTVFHETGEDGDVTLRTPLGTPGDWAVARSELNVATLEWQIDVPLPAARMKELGAGRYVAYVEEVDRRMAASFASEPVAPAETFREATYREQGPRFSARVPFLDVR